MKGRTISFDDISVSNLGGARLAVRGNVTDFDQPLRRFDIAFNFDAPDLAPRAQGRRRDGAGCLRQGHREGAAYRARSRR